MAVSAVPDGAEVFGALVGRPDVRVDVGNDDVEASSSLSLHAAVAPHHAATTTIARRRRGLPRTLAANACIGDPRLARPVLQVSELRCLSTVFGRGVAQRHSVVPSVTITRRHPPLSMCTWRRRARCAGR